MRSLGIPVRRALFALTLTALGASSLVAQPRLLTVEVVDVDGRPLNGVFLRLAGDEPDARVRDGRVTLQLPPDVEPGDDVLLHLDDSELAFFEPVDGRLRVPRAGGVQTTRVTLMRRARPEQLEREAVRRSLAEQVLESLSDSGGSPSSEALVSALSEPARRYDLDPEAIDRALRQWDEEALGDLDRRLLDRYLDFFPEAVKSQDGRIVFLGPVLIQSRAEYFLRAPLEGLGFGETAVLEVGSAPAEGMDGVRCDWTFRPDDFLIVKDDGRRDCALNVALPKGPVDRYGSKLSLEIEVEVKRDGERLDLIQKTPELSNGLALRATVEGTPLTPNGQALVTVGREGEASPLPATYECSWSDTEAPFRVVPTATNGCSARIELIPLDQWGSDVLIAWLSSWQTGRGPAWAVTATLGGRPVPGGTTQFSVEVHETRPRSRLEAELNARLRQETEQRLAERDREQLESELERLGLPSLDDLKASDLKLRATVGSSGWSLQLLYIGGSKSGEALVVTGRRSPLRVLFSDDGTNFDTPGRFGGRDPLELARLDHRWVKLEVNSRSSRRVGPFRLELDGEKLLLDAVRRFWRDLDEAQRQKLACRRFTGLNPTNAQDGRMLLPLLESVSIHRIGGTVERSETYGATLEALESPTYQPVPRPLAGVPYLLRMQWADGSTESFECPADYGVGGPRNGFHHVLNRVGGSADSGPPQIEVFVEQSSREGQWRVQFDRRFQPAFVRYSTDGETWNTVKPSGLHGTFVNLQKPQGERLDLRFVAEDGTELHYGAATSFQPR